MAGYSGTPLVKKLGLAPGSRHLLEGDVPKQLPEGLESLPENTSLVRSKGRGPFDGALLFVLGRAPFAKAFPLLTKRIREDGGIWVAWPKKTSGLVTDVTENVVRDVVLPTGWVDVKVCAIDETWSGLRCVLRKELRGKRRAPSARTSR